MVRLIKDNQLQIFKTKLDQMINGANDKDQVEFDYTGLNYYRTNDYQKLINVDNLRFNNKAKRKGYHLYSLHGRTKRVHPVVVNGDYVCDLDSGKWIKTTDEDYGSSTSKVPEDIFALGYYWFANETYYEDFINEKANSNIDFMRFFDVWSDDKPKFNQAGYSARRTLLKDVWGTDLPSERVVPFSSKADMRLQLMDKLLYDGDISFFQVMDMRKSELLPVVSKVQINKISVSQFNFKHGVNDGVKPTGDAASTINTNILGGNGSEILKRIADGKASIEEILIGDGRYDDSLNFRTFASPIPMSMEEVRMSNDQLLNLDPISNQPIPMSMAEYNRQLLNIRAN